MTDPANVHWMDNYKRKHPHYGTIEQRDDKGNLLQVTQGIVVGRGDTKQVIDPEEIFELATLYCTFNEIADWFDLPVETLKYNFRDLIEKGYQSTKQKLRRKQIQVACEGNVTMLIWLGKNLLGQTDAPINAENTSVLPWNDDEAE